MKVVFDNLSDLKSKNNITPWLFLWWSIFQGGLGACVPKLNAVNFPSELAYEIDGVSSLNFELS